MLCGIFSVNLSGKILVIHRDTQRYAKCDTEPNVDSQYISIAQHVKILFCLLNIFADFYYSA